MDNFCINLGTLLDNGAVTTLEEPNRHSVHCLVDIDVCYESGYAVLTDPVQDGALYTVGYRLDEAGSATLRALGQETGDPANDCRTCTGGGTLQEGFRAGIMGTVTDVSGSEPVISVESAVYVSPDTVFCSAEEGDPMEEGDAPMEEETPTGEDPPAEEPSPTEPATSFSLVTSTGGLFSLLW